MWKVFNSTPGSQIHVNRVFVRPDVPLRKEKKFRKQNAVQEKTNARFRARRDLRRRMLKRIYENLVPGEQVFILVEKYDFYHEGCYSAFLVSQRNMYCVKAYEIKEKGTFIEKHPLSSDDYDNFTVLAKQLKSSDGNCEMVDSRNYPTFFSVKKENGKWTTAVCSADNSVWSYPNEKQKDYFQSVSKLMRFISEIEYLRNSRQVPPVLVKK